MTHEDIFGYDSWKLASPIEPSNEWDELLEARRLGQAMASHDLKMIANITRIQYVGDELGLLKERVHRVEAYVVDSDKAIKDAELSGDSLGFETELAYCEAMSQALDELKASLDRMPMGRRRSDTRRIK